MEPADRNLRSVIAALDPVLAEARAKGGRLPPERALCDSLGVPRRRLRLALDELQARGIVFRRHGQGTFAVPPPHPDASRRRLLAGALTLDQLMDVRRRIEPRLAELAAIHARPEDLDPLRDLMQRSRDAATPQDYDLADEVFHYRIAQLAGNALYLEMYDLIRQMRRETTWRARRAETNIPEIMRILGDQHRAIFDAIASGNSLQAGAAQRLHLRFVASTV